MQLSAEAKKILNDDSHLARRNLWFKRLENLFSGKPDPYVDEFVFCVDGILGSSGVDLYEKPEEWVLACLENLSQRTGETEDDYTFVPACIEHPAFGVHFIDRIFGARVFFKDGQWWNEPLKTPVGDLAEPDLDNDKTFDLARRAAVAFLEQDVRIPVFGLPTIASVLNVAVNLYGEEILTAILLEPEKAEHDFKIINEVLIKVHRWYREVLPKETLQPVISWQRTQPFGFGQICGCSTALLSNAAYREFIQPLDTALLEVYPNGGMIHLCGDHVRHIESFREIKALRAFQINDRAAWDFETYFKELRNDQIIYLNPCEGMTVEKAVGLSGGERLVIAGVRGKEIRRENRKAGGK
ncbi:MAG: hypothetical protein LBF78_15270 [Treponema sp.]|jgi:hypothetical protein|nr:hypothetical protein [Treponema sp.]